MSEEGGTSSDAPTPPPDTNIVAPEPLTATHSDPDTPDLSSMRTSTPEDPSAPEPEYDPQDAVPSAPIQ